MTTPTKSHPQFILAIASDFFNIDIDGAPVFSESLTRFSHVEFIERVQSFLAIRERWHLDMSPNAITVTKGNPNYKQVLPYLTVWQQTENSDLLCYPYHCTKIVGESRLAGNGSIGYGGHIDLVDIQHTESVIDFLNTIMVATYREASEEFTIYNPDDTIVHAEDIGIDFSDLFILDNSNEVGKLHVGVVMQLVLPVGYKLLAKEDELANLPPTKIDALLNDSTFNPENWTQLLMNWWLTDMTFGASKTANATWPLGHPLENFNVVAATDVQDNASNSLIAGGLFLNHGGEAVIEVMPSLMAGEVGGIVGASTLTAKTIPNLIPNTSGVIRNFAMPIPTGLLRTKKMLVKSMLSVLSEPNWFNNHWLECASTVIAEIAVRFNTNDYEAGGNNSIGVAFDDLRVVLTAAYSHVAGWSKEAFDVRKAVAAVEFGCQVLRDDLFSNQVVIETKAESTPTTSILAIPVWSEAAASKFVDVSVYPPVNIPDSTDKTSFLKFGEKLDLLGISQRDELLASGEIHQCDLLDPVITLCQILCADNTGNTFVMDVSNQAMTTFVVTSNDDCRLLALSAPVMVGAQLMTFAGTVNLEMGLLIVNVVNVHKTNSGDSSLTPLGYTLLAKRVNYNRKPV